MQDPLQHLPGYVLRRTSAAMMAAFAARMELLGLRTVEATILQILATQPGLSQSAMGRLLDIQRANMTPIAARLEARGLLCRRPSDGRSLGLELTEKGAELAQRVEKEVTGFEADLAAALPEADRAHLLPALKALWAHYAS